MCFGAQYFLTVAELGSASIMHRKGRICTQEKYKCLQRPSHGLQAVRAVCSKHRASKSPEETKLKVYLKKARGNVAMLIDLHRSFGRL